MSRRKLGRLAGFAVVVALVFGTPAIASASVEDKAEVSSNSVVTGYKSLIDIIWG
ncbi:MAG: hypothetical protein ABWX96_22360 [Propionibacteriaceae bacterium]